jgi:hypothetical protein
MWQKTPGDKVTWREAVANAGTFNLAGYTDWRLPTIKELYSLIDFNGVTGRTESDSVPYLDTTYFDFSYGDTAAGERMIDAQYWSSIEYVSTTMNDSHTVFGVNFADGRIKGYGTHMGTNREMYQFVRYVRGSSSYGANAFVDDGSGAITDQVTGLTWMQLDSGALGAGASGDGSMNWNEALAWCETLDYAGYTDWRLPNAKELQSIVDYSRSPDTTGSAAIDPLFSVTAIIDELGQINYPYFWTSTTHMDGVGQTVYIAFGEALGYMNGRWVDVHGAGAQRSDPKSGNPADYSTGRGPQGDSIRIYNYVRCVRGGAEAVSGSGEVDQTVSLPGGSEQSPAGAQGQQPPQEAVGACAGLSQGSACQFNTPSGAAVTGTCAVLQDQLACLPTGGPPGQPQQ